jgi:E3 ubiquitin-protein ligase HERC1
MTSGLLELQVKQSRRILSQADIVSLINQKVQVFNRMGYAYRCIFQRKLKSPSSSREVQDQNSNVPSSTRSSLGSIDTDRDRIGSQALIELGLTTGLALVFALMKQNWQQQQQNPGSNMLCNEVLKTALRVLSSLPMMSLANAVNASDIGQATLNQVTDFLIQSMNPTLIGDDKEGSILATEILLLLGVQRGKLSLICNGYIMLY